MGLRNASAGLHEKVSHVAPSKAPATHHSEAAAAAGDGAENAQGLPAHPAEASAA